MLKPIKLQAGDTVATISLSWGGAGVLPHRYAAGKRELEQRFGLHVVESRYALREPEWIARNPQARAEDLMEVFANPQIKAVFSNIGGNDSIRILPYLDLDVLRQNPKIFMGYSDTTISHLALYKAGVGSFYGPSVLAGFAENCGVFPYTEDAVRRCLFSSEPIGELKPNKDGWTVEHLDWSDPANQNRRRKLTPSTGWRWLQGKGVVQGRLLGGCIEVLDWLRGTEFWPSLDQWQDAVLFLEASEDMPTPEAVKYMLRCLGAVGALQRCSAILYARPGGHTMPIEQHTEYDRVLLEVLNEELGLSDLPIISNIDFGHTDPMLILPYGALTEIDCEQQTVRILEAAVRDA